MGKKRKHAAQPLWPFVIRSESRQERDTEFARGCLESRRRFSALKSSVKHNRLSATLQNLEARWMQTRSEYYENRVDLDLRRILADLIARAKRDGFEARELVTPFLALHHFKALDPHGDRGEKALLAAFRQASMYGGDTSEIRKENAKRAREWRESIELLLTAPADRAMLDNFVRLFGVHVGGVDIAAETILDRDDHSLICILEPELDLDVVTAALRGRCEDGPLSPAEIENLASYTSELRRQSQDISTKTDDYWNKLSLALKYVVGPTDIFEHDNDNCHHFLDLITGLYRCILSEHIMGSGQTEQIKARLRMFDDAETIWDVIATDEVFLAILCRRPQTWYVILQQILAQNGAVNGESLQPWALPLLSSMVQHPSKLKKHRVPDCAARARSALARYVAPILTGHHSDDEAKLFGEDSLENAEARHALHIIAERVALSVAESLHAQLDDNVEEQKDLPQALESADKRAAAAKAVATFIAPNFDAILVRCCEDILGEPEEVPSPEELAGMYPDLNMEIEEEEAEAARARTEKAMTWYYVDRPASDSRGHRLVLKPGERDIALEKFFRKRRVDTVIKPESIAGALDHFCAMPDKVRHVAPKEQIGDDSWIKLKRGKMRILAREDEEGKLLFHVYQRKVWNSDMFDTKGGPG